MRYAQLILTQTEPCVFSERAATEGEHRTLGHPTGAALLGWAAARTQYLRGGDPFTAFHSGKVRFSNALPVAKLGHPTYPMPQLLMEPKHERGGVKKDGMLDESIVRVGRPTEETDRQYENLGRGFLTLAGEVLRPNVGARLRTAIEDGRGDQVGPKDDNERQRDTTGKGRAKTGMLFGYSHLKPDDTPRFVATIEADDGALSDADWNKLRDAFSDKTLRLGRAAGTSYGGAFRCTWNETGVSPWPDSAIAAGAKLVRVWALSDLALTDAYGAPAFVPDYLMLGLPEGGVFKGDASALSLRRYSPWNRHLGSRDIERQVIEAGSAMTFCYKDGVGADWTGACQGKALAGSGCEAGLGRLWVQPPILMGEHPKLDEAAQIVASKIDPAEANEPEGNSDSARLVRWALREKARRATA